jgi:hypothetical protein
VEYCGYTHRTVTAPLTRNAECVCDHSAWEQRSAPAALADCTPAQLVAAAGLPGGGELDGVSFEVGRMAFAELVLCKDCGVAQQAEYFVPADESAGLCVHCGGATRAEPFYRHNPVPAGLLAQHGEQPLSAFGAKAPPWVIVRGRGRAVLFRDNNGRLSAPDECVTKEQRP